MNDIVMEMVNAGARAVEALKARISDVRLAPFTQGQTLEEITFKVDNQTYQGKLKGRNADLLVGYSEEIDKAIACRVLLDGDAKLI